MKMPEFIVERVGGPGLVCFHARVEAFSEKGAIEKAMNSADGKLAMETWHQDKWEWRARPVRKR